MKAPALTEFYRKLHARGETAGTLAAALGLTNHTYVSRLVHGRGRRRDGVWWPRLRALLTAEELALIVPAPVYTFPTVRAAVAALPDATEVAPAPPLALDARVVAAKPRQPFSRPADPAVSAFINWRQQRAG